MFKKWALQSKENDHVQEMTLENITKKRYIWGKGSGKPNTNINAQEMDFKT